MAELAPEALLVPVNLSIPSMLPPQHTLISPIPTRSTNNAGAHSQVLRHVRENTVLPRGQAAGSWEPSHLRLESSQPSTSNLHHAAHPSVLGRKGYMQRPAGTPGDQGKIKKLEELRALT